MSKKVTPVILGVLLVVLLALVGCRPEDGADPGTSSEKPPDLLTGYAYPWFFDQYPNHNWMEKMDSALVDVPLTKAIIPGSHDSGTYSIRDDAPFSPDLNSDDQLKQMVEASSALGPRVNYYMARFARAQGEDIYQQLLKGIRYFDLRPGAADNGKSSQLLAVHSLYGGDLLAMVDQVKKFLQIHHQEVIILDFSHFTAMNDEHHRQLIDYLKSAFGTKLAPHPLGATSDNPGADTYTFGKLWDNGWQVICLYHDSRAANEPRLWQYGTPEEIKWWPKKPTPSAAKIILESLLQHDRPQLSGGSFFVLQTVLTGDEPLYANAVIKLELQIPLDEAKAELAPYQKTIDARQAELDTTQNTISEVKADIADLEDWVDDNWYNVPGVINTEAKIAKAKTHLLTLKATELSDKAKLKIAEGLAAAPKAKVALLQKAVDSVPGPTSLAEMANAGNPTMVRWLAGWKGKGLNIVIQDFPSKAFIDEIRYLNRASNPFW